MIINPSLLGIGFILLVLGFLIGFKKMTFLLSGFNENRVKDKNKLALLVGITEMILGAILILLGLINFQYTETAVLAIVAITVAVMIYANKTMVE